MSSASPADHPNEPAPLRVTHRETGDPFTWLLYPVAGFPTVKLVEQVEPPTHQWYFQRIVDGGGFTHLADRIIGRAHYNSAAEARTAWTARAGRQFDSGPPDYIPRPEVVPPETIEQRNRRIYEQHRGSKSFTRLAQQENLSPGHIKKICREVQREMAAEGGVPQLRNDTP